MSTNGPFVNLVDVPFSLVRWPMNIQLARVHSPTVSGSTALPNDDTEAPDMVLG